MKPPKYIIAAIVGLMPCLAQSNDLTGGNFAVDPSSASSGLQNFVPGGVSLGNGFFNNVSGSANFVTGQNNQSFGSFISILGYGNLANASAITCTILGTGNQVSARNTNIFGNTLSDGGWAGSTVMGDGNPFGIRTFTVPFGSSGANSFNAVFNGGYQFRTNDGQGGNPVAGVYINPSSPNTASTSFNALVGVNTPTPVAGLEVAIGPDVTTGGLLSAGPNIGSHIAIDDDDIQRYFGNSPVTLYLNFYGGDVEIGSAGATTTINGTFVNASDRNAKEDIAPVDSKAVLDRVLALPVSTWKYKGAEERRHIGPMAQDFHASFDELLNLNSDDKTIAPLDEAGIAFTAIQGLNEVVKEKDAKIRNLEERLARLEKLIPGGE